jgi:predicted site-specific integrase-resolvase
MEKAGEIDTIRSPKGHRRYDVAGYISKQSGKTLTTIGYCRVNQKTEADNLKEQIAFVKSHYPDAEIISDFGSGINFKRKGLKALLERVLQGDKLRIVVAHKDRLARFGGEVIEFLVEQNGGEVVALDQTVYSREEELRADLLSVLNVFSRRMHGLRKHRDKIKEDRHLSKGRTERETA